MASTIRGLVGAPLRPLARWLTRDRVRILFYHRFAARSRRGRLGADVLEGQLRHLRRHFNLVRLADVAAALKTRSPLPVRPAVVTVDDGYVDFAEHAYPVLRRLGIPATLFVVSEAAVAGRWLWFDALRFAIENAKARELRFDFASRRFALPLASDVARERAWHALGDLGLAIGCDERSRLVDEVARAGECPVPSRPPTEFAAIDVAGLRALDPELVEIGSHGATHTVLSRCADAQLREEVGGSRSVLEQALARPVVSFCIPNGLPDDYDARVLAAVEAAGYECAVTSHGGLVSRRPPGTERFRLPRFGASASSTAFRNEVAGVTTLRAEWIGGVAASGGLSSEASSWIGVGGG